MANENGDYVLEEGKYTSITVTSTDDNGTGTAVLSNVVIDQVAPDFEGDSIVDILDSIAAGISFKVEDIDTIGYYEGAQTGQTIGQIVAEEARDSDSGIYRYEWADTNDATQQSWYQLNPDGTVSLTAAGVASAMNDYETGIKSVQLDVKAIDVAGNESVETITFVLGNTIGIGAIIDTMNTTDKALDDRGRKVDDVNASGALQPSDNPDKIYVGKNEDGTSHPRGNGNMWDANGGEDPIILSGGGADFISAGAIYTGSKIYSGTGDDTLLINDINGLNANTSSAPFFFTEEGDDLLVTSDDIYASNVMMGSGSDQVIINGNLRGESTVNLGSNVGTTLPTSQNGNVLAGYQYYLDNNLGTDTVGDTADDINTITVTGNVSAQARIIGGLGQDNVVVNGSVSSADIILDEGEDILTLGSLEGGSATVYTGNTADNEDNAMDTVTINNMSGSTVYLGNDDNFQITGEMSNGTVNFAASNDTTTLNTVSGGTVNTGAGNDIVNISASMTNGSINLGDGNDTINVASYKGGQINGGAGFDILDIQTGSNEVSLSDVTNIESIDLHGTTIRLADVNRDDLTNDIYIKGGSDNSVNIGRQTGTNTAELSPSANGKWSDTGDLTKDSVTYDVWTNDQGGTYTVYIEQGIDVI